MLASVVRATQALAIWRYVESSSAREDASPAELKAAAAQAHEQFLQAAYEVAFALFPLLLNFGEVTTENEVRYSAAAAVGGFVIQKMNLDPDNLGIFLTPEGTSVLAAVPIPPPATENWLQLFIDLPKLLEILGVQQ